MNTLYIERSASMGRNGAWVNELALDPAPDRIVVGTGPGSFAGIRAALAFAQGYALGRACEVLGLPSPCAVAAQAYARDPSLKETPLAVLGDARRGKIWIALFAGYELVKEVFQIDATGDAALLPRENDATNGDAALLPREKLTCALPPACRVVTVDEARIGSLLKEAFGERYLGGCVPTSEGLRAFAEANPAILKPEPLPIYLNPAVRP